MAVLIFVCFPPNAALCAAQTSSRLCALVCVVHDTSIASERLKSNLRALPESYSQMSATMSDTSGTPLSLSTLSEFRVSKLLSEGALASKASLGTCPQNACQMQDIVL